MDEQQNSGSNEQASGEIEALAADVGEPHPSIRVQLDASAGRILRVLAEGIAPGAEERLRRAGEAGLAEFMRELRDLEGTERPTWRVTFEMPENAHWQPPEPKRELIGIIDKGYEHPSREWLAEAYGRDESAGTQRPDLPARGAPDGRSVDGHIDQSLTEPQGESRT